MVDGLLVIIEFQNKYTYIVQNEKCITYESRHTSSSGLVPVTAAGKKITYKLWQKQKQGQKKAQKKKIQTQYCIDIIVNRFWPVITLLSTTSRYSSSMVCLKVW